MAKGLYESDFEETTIERLKCLGYEYLPAHQWMTRSSLKDIVNEERLAAFLTRKYPNIPKREIPRLISMLTVMDDLTVERRNRSFHLQLVNGITFSYEEAGEIQFVEVIPIDWEHPEFNDFMVMNQLRIKGRFSRIPDLIIYINGLPLVVFELKSPYREDPTIDGAHLQLQHYVRDIEQLFDFNSFVVISDGVQTKHGMPFAPMEYFAEWKSIDGYQIENNPAHSMRTMIEGLFPKERLLQYIRRFIFFQSKGDGAIKIGAKYHQYFGAMIAYESALKEARPYGSKKIGTIFHSTGSGKSFTMLFLSNLLRRARSLENPTIVLQVDRTDLDEQLYKTFVSAESFIGKVEQADSADDLRDLLQNEAGKIILSTIEKFRLKEGEADHPVLSERHNVIVIADEAHRTQYGVKGFAGNLRQALPNSAHIAFSGTPVAMIGRDTVDQFGPVIHTYDMVQSVEDGATVRLTYNPQLIPLDINNEDLDQDFADIIEQGSAEDASEQYKRKYAALKKVVGTPTRIKQLARDIVKHFHHASIENQWAKGMVVTMSRDICVALYDEMKKIPNCPPMEVVMTGKTSDPIEWKNIQEGSRYSHIKTKDEKKQVKDRLADPYDPLKLCLVVDMFLTGSDFPPMSYLYVDKHMKDHNLIQAIARVNRVFPEKESGQIVDFIGIAEYLKNATKTYTGSRKTRKTVLEPEECRLLFWDALEKIRGIVPSEIPVKKWRTFDKIERENVIADLVGYFLGSELEKDYLEAELRLSKAYKLVQNDMEIRPVADEVILYEIVKTQIRKVALNDNDSEKKLEEKLSRLVENSLTTKQTIDIFKVAGIEKPDISILDESFTMDVKDKQHTDLRLKLLKQLLEDQIKVTYSKQKKKSKSMSDLLRKTLDDYHNRIITAADLILMMTKMQQDLRNEEQKRRDLGLSEEEVAFYDLVASMGEKTFTNEFMANLVHQVLKEMKKQFQVDWAEPHRSDILAKVSLAVKKVLIREKVSGEAFQFLSKAFVDEAKVKYYKWPMDA